MILIELLTTCQRAPRDQLVHVGVARVVAHLFALDARPSWGRDDFARLGGNFMEANFRVLRPFSQMRV